MDKEQKLKNITDLINAANLPAGTWMIVGDIAQFISRYDNLPTINDYDDFETEADLNNVDILIDTSSWFYMYESVTITWSLALPDPEIAHQRMDPPRLFIQGQDDLVLSLMSSSNFGTPKQLAGDIERRDHITINGFEYPIGHHIPGFSEFRYE